MGLDLSVGYLSDLKEADPDAFLTAKKEFKIVSDALVAAGLRHHVEPDNLPEDERFCCQLWGYSGLHLLRRIAAHLAFKNQLPKPGRINGGAGKDDSDDPLLQEYFDDYKRPLRLFSRLVGKKKPLPRFLHLSVHGDANGIYVPQDFEDIVVLDKELDHLGLVIGSSQRLLAECNELARHLEMPLDLDHESDEVWDAPDSQGEGDTKWLRYGIESFCCIRLIRACEASLRSGAALVFC